jgi:hypothetical protein
MIPSLGEARLLPFPGNATGREKAMKFMTTWEVIPGSLNTAVERFLSGKVEDPKGVKVLGRWHAQGARGWTLYETDNPVALFEASSAWADVLTIHSTVVIEDAEAGPILAGLLKK